MDLLELTLTSYLRNKKCVLLPSVYRKLNAQAHAKYAIYFKVLHHRSPGPIIVPRRNEVAEGGYWFVATGDIGLPFVRQSVRPSVPLE